MTLRLTVENVPSLASGDPVEMVLAEHGLVIGRAAHADWTLPDPANHVSSIHCEVDYRDGRYFLTDKSTNGTFINGAGERLARPVQLRDGDLLQIGHYQVRVEEVPDGRGAGPVGGTATGGGFGGIDWHQGADTAAKPVATDRFGREAPRPLFQSAQDPLMAAFAPPRPQAPAPYAPGGDPFGIAAPLPATGGGSADPFGLAVPSPTPAAQPFAPPPTTGAPDPFGTAAAPPAASDPFDVAPIPSPAIPAAPTPAADPFGMAAARPDPFAAPSLPPTAAPDPFGMTPAAIPAQGQSPAAAPARADPWALLGGANTVDFTAPPPAQPPAAPPPPPAPAPAIADAPPAPMPPSASPETPDGLYTRLLATMGLDRRDMGTRGPEAVVDAIGQLLRQTADGLFRLLEARTRVRHQFGVGAQTTVFQREGNNPLKWTRSSQEALKQMIGEPARGFLEGTQAVRGAFEDLQAHEMAMMAAMQEAMQETIRRFAPDTIRARISAKGWLKSVLPGSREATLWRAYESEFTAFADESEAAYLDLFARQFKKAYERIVSADKS